MTDENVDIVRLLIADEDPDNQIFDDGKIQAFLTLEGGNAKLAAAQALHTIAISEALIAKVIKTQDLSTDGVKLAAELRAQAAALREQVAADADAADDGFFDIVDFDSGCRPELTDWPVL